MNIFISHSSEDSALALEALSYLEARGDSCFYAPRDIAAGHEYAEEIINGIDKSDMVLLIMTKAANASVHVLREVERAVSRQIPIIVYKAEDVELTKSMEYFLMSHQWLDSSKSLTEALDGVSYKITRMPSKKSSPKAVVVIAVLCAIVITALAVLALFMLDNDDENTDLSSVIPIEFSLGDSIEMGQYNGENIEWRIVKLEGDKALLITDKIITIKAFDAAEGGKFNYCDGKDYWTTKVIEDEEIGRLARGDNRWELSNLRTWLNSDKENVEYPDMPPEKAAMSEGKNAYDTESGFLCAFTEKELSLILQTEVTTNDTVTSDRVFLLSSAELEWLKTADISIDATPTDKAFELDSSGWYKLYLEEYDTTDHYWWLRDADGVTSYGVMTVPNSLYHNTPQSEFASLEGYGVRPVMWVEITDEYFLQ